MSVKIRNQINTGGMHFLESILDLFIALIWICMVKAKYISVWFINFYKPKYLCIFWYFDFFFDHNVSIYYNFFFTISVIVEHSITQFFWVIYSTYLIKNGINWKPLGNSVRSTILYLPGTAVQVGRVQAFPGTTDT